LLFAYSEKKIFIMASSGGTSCVLRELSCTSLQSIEWLGKVVHTCNSSTQKAEAGGTRVTGQLELYHVTLSKKERKESALSFLTVGHLPLLRTCPHILVLECFSLRQPTLDLTSCFSIQPSYKILNWP
jgi:hypothetical protein